MPNSGTRMRPGYRQDILGVENEQEMTSEQTTDWRYLKEIATRVRARCLSMIAEAQAGHIGGSLSCTDMIVALYFGGLMHVDPHNPHMPDRDRFVLSKGHASPALYATLAEKGFLPADALATFDDIDSIVQGHPDMKLTPGVDMSTGSLGQGLSAGVGMALGARQLGLKSRVFVLLGDGECQEGQVWEAALTASHYRLSNLTAIVDVNGIQLLAPTDEVLSLAPFRAKWESFGWRVREIDGHDFGQILAALDKDGSTSDPTVILARTVKGKGVSFMENKAEWHSKPPSRDQLSAALLELETAGKGGLLK